MECEISRGRAIAAALFALAVLGLAGFGLYQLGGRRWRVQPTFHVRAQFDSIGGLEAGSKVRLQGIEAGIVERVVPPAEPGRPVEVVMRIDQKLRPLVRADATAKVASQGFIGLKSIEIVPGTPSSPPLADSGVIHTEKTLDLADVQAAAARSLGRLDAAAAKAEAGIAQVRAITESVARGEGTLGRLIRDEALYFRLVALADRGEKATNGLQDNMDAVKHTWPLSRYFEGRAYYDHDRVLYKPGAERAARSLAADELFEPDRAILTERGKEQLDEAARWFQTIIRPSTEIVIAAFTDPGPNEDQARILTQEQAEAVRTYLVRNYALNAAGWFRSRKVAAVGFGSHVPEIPGAEAASERTAPRRVDVVLFTPPT